jgi:hypothetical protein
VGDENHGLRVAVQNTPRASCGLRDPGGSSARPTGEGWAVRAAASPAPAASASRRRTSRSAARSRTAETRGLATRSPSSARCCTRHPCRN